VKPGDTVYVTRLALTKGIARSKVLEVRPDWVRVEWRGRSCCVSYEADGCFGCECFSSGEVFSSEVEAVMEARAMAWREAKRLRAMADSLELLDTFEVFDAKDLK